MFPGHGFNAQVSGEPPFELSLSMNVYTTWEEIRVRLQAKAGNYFGGMFIQARRANCSHPLQHEALGTFQLLPGEAYLKPVSCGDRINNSISHNSNRSLDHAVFKWFAPAVEVGHIYFVATVVKEKAIFWTNIYSPVLRYIQSTSAPEICPAKRYLHQSFTSPSVVTTPSSAISSRRVDTGTAALLTLVLLLAFYNR